MPTSRDVVLVVEDEVALRKLVVRTLTRHGYRVLEACAGNEGLVMAAEAGEGLRLVISDVVMPKMNGPELVRRLRALRPHLRLMFMSGYAGDVIERDGVETNVPFLEKPFTSHDLLQKVQELLNAQ